MIGYYMKIGDGELSNLIALAKERGAEGVDDEISALLSDDDRCLDIDKAWHGIQVMLGGDKESPDVLPAHDAVFGGRALNDVEMAYLPVRYFDAAEVRSISASIAGIDLLGRSEDFRTLVLDNAEVYPGLTEVDDINYLDYNFELLKRFFASAAGEGMCILSFIG